MKKHKKFSLPLHPLWLVMAVMLIVSIVSLVFLGLGIWKQYRTSVIDNQKEQMLLTTQALSLNMQDFMEDTQTNLETLCLTIQKTGTLQQPENSTAFIQAFQKIHTGKIWDVMITDSQQQVLFHLADTTIETTFQTTVSDGYQLSQVQLDDGRICLMMGRQLDEEHMLWLLADLQYYYEHQMSALHVGQNGYVLVKNSDGIILMHPEPHQLGIDVIGGRETLYPDVDLDSLKQLVEQQNKGGSGVMEYSSYWWMDPELPLVRKISAWSPVPIGGDFLVISAVIDYDEVYRPLEQGVVRLGFVFLALTLCSMGGIIILGRLILEHRRSRAEIIRLEQVNRTLEQLRQQEQALAHKQRLQILGTMTGGIAHEFNNLLTPILGHAEMMLLDLPEDSELYDSAQEISSAALHCKQLISQLSLLGRKKVEAKLEPLLAQDVFSSILKMVPSLCPDIVELSSNLKFGNAVIDGNRTQLSQVVLNLCVNAVHAMEPQGGTLSLTGQTFSREQLLQQGMTPPSTLWEQWVCLKVSDTGCGMDQDTLSQIFDPFFTTKKPGQGTGLGLPLADQLVRAHSGSLTAHSQPGIGSTFTILLPVSQTEFS